MNNNFRLRAAMRSDEELRERVNNREKYLPETVEASVAELSERGVTFSDEELRIIDEDMLARREIAAGNNHNPGIFRNDANLYIDDPDAPIYYSKRAILIFSILFSVLFGSVMLAMNVSRSREAGKAFLVVLYGLGFTVLTGLLTSSIKMNLGITIITAYVGALIMEMLFWNRYVGKTTLYRPKPIWGPLITGILLASIIVYLIIISGTAL
ncbi:MAG TPA: Nif11-like leader peptide family natural product precursor [Mucilaginibacter sp.]|nr:Nif11-like leader peptide family natural product precursor [Mucilaginibacter sp.]